MINVPGRNNSAAFLLVAIVFFLASGLLGRAQESSVLVLKTSAGVLYVSDVAEGRFTIEITGRNIRPASSGEHFFLHVDGKVMQIQTALITQVLPGSGKPRGGDKAILVAHKEWELKHISGLLAAEIPAESEVLTLSGKRECLLWSFPMPKGHNTEARAQLFLTTVVGDQILVLNSVASDQVSEEAAREFLEETLKTIKVYDAPIDLKGLQERLRSSAK